MSELARMFAGVTLLIFPVVPIYSAYLSRYKKPAVSDQQKALIRGGHAHANSLIVLSIVAQILLDAANLAIGLEWVVRFSFPFVAFLMAICYMRSVHGKGGSKSAEFTRYTTLALVLFCFSVIVLGVGLVNYR